MRLVCAASAPIAPMAEDGSFDAALYHQLSGLTIRVPSIAEHAEDVPDLATSMLTALVDANEVPLRVLTVGAQNALRNLDWHGNLPVLQNAVKTLALTALGAEIGGDDVARVAREFSLAAPRPAAHGGGRFARHAAREAREQFERQYFLHHIRREDGNMSRVADRVGLERTHLYRKLKQLGIRPSSQGRGSRRLRRR